MITKFKNEDLRDVVDIWLQSNITAHHFISENYWKSMLPEVETMLPMATLYVNIVDGKIVGFIGLDDNHIEGIFIHPDHQSKGYGKDLLEHAKTIYSTLTLNVYDKNVRAKKFYLRENFEIVEESIDLINNEIDLVMTWSKI